MNGSEAIGELAQSALTARAFEPDHGKKAAATSDQPACLNCGTVLAGHYCHACGQAAHVHKSVGAFFHDLLHGVFHFEGKVWRTLPKLALHPGALTREYIDGRRASYVSPIALFLFCVFLMFAVVKNVGGHGSETFQIDFTASRPVTQIKADIAALEGQRAALIAKGLSTDAIDGKLEGQRQILEIKENMSGEAGKGPSSSVPAIDHALKAFVADPRLGLYKLQSNAYKFSWALIPISALFVWLLFPLNRRYGLYDHAVFVTYSLCFMSLGVTILSLADAAGLGFLWLTTLIVVPLHMYRQLRGTYALSRGSALWRSGAMLFFALFALTLFAMLVLAQSG